jgi:ABC-type nitrate/sulfonate/bicarbonate transport system substrate-binding protein
MTNKFGKLLSRTVIFVSLVGINGCFVNSGGQGNTTTSETPAVSSSGKSLAGSSSYTPYDAISMVWARDDKTRQMVWTNSGGESGKLLTSNATTGQRPDWILATQGVVNGLAAKGEKVKIIGVVYNSSDAIRPVFRIPKKPLAGQRTLPIPRSSIEFGLNALLKREGVAADNIKIPKVEKPNFPTITSLLTKPATDKDALDFAILVEPFITNVMTAKPKEFVVGAGGIYDMHYSIVVRESDLKARRPEYIKLLKELLEADKKIAAFKDDNAFYQEVSGRDKDGKPELFTKTLTYKREPAKLQLQVTQLRKLMKEELTYLTQKYPGDLKMPDNIDDLVDPSLLKEVAPDRVTP